MNLDRIYLVANLASYDFENVVLLAGDIDAIVSELIAATGSGTRQQLEDCEKLLFLGHILAKALEVSRTVVKNWDMLEELLRVNWEGEATEKWNFVREEGGSGIVNRVAKRILLGSGGEKCLSVVKMFYKKFSNKEEFRKVIGEVQKELLWKGAAVDYLELKGSVNPEVKVALENVDRMEGLGSDNPKELIRTSAQWDLPAIVSGVSSGTIDSKNLNKLLAGISINIQTRNETFLTDQLVAIRNTTKNRQSMKTYQDLMEFQPFYEVNLEILKTHHRSLQEKELLYDSNTILLCHLLYVESTKSQFLKDFLNEESFGGPSNLELILAELQNFT